jgi:hypothetical protein
MAFARLFPINATNAQDGDRTFSERLGLSDDACGSPRNDCGDSPALAQYGTDSGLAGSRGFLACCGLFRGFGLGLLCGRRRLKRMGAATTISLTPSSGHSGDASATASCRSARYSGVVPVGDLGGKPLHWLIGDAPSARGASWQVPAARFEPLAVGAGFHHSGPSRSAPCVPATGGKRREPLAWQVRRLVGDAVSGVLEQSKRPARHAMALSRS